MHLLGIWPAEYPLYNLATLGQILTSFRQKNPLFGEKIPL